MSFKVGLIGKPNVGKSTIFSALTKHNAEIGNYPFTTVKPNMGTAFIRFPCPDNDKGRKCTPADGYCLNGTRYIPVQIVDVPGLIEGASEGKGMGNQFLESVRDSDAIIQLFDASGRTDMMGNPLPVPEPGIAEEIDMVRNELRKWLSSFISRDWERFAKKADSSGDRPGKSLQTKLSQLRLTEHETSEILASGVFPSQLSIWGESDFSDLASLIIERTKPGIYLGNKMDLLDERQAEETVSLRNDLYLTSGETELILMKAREAGILRNEEPPFDISEMATDQQRSALLKLQETTSRKFYTGVRKALEITVFSKLKRIVVFPVYDESTWEDRQGRLLPDAFLMREGDTALDLAFRIHTDIGENFIRAIDGKTKRTLGKDHPLSNGDIIKIVSKS